MLGSGVWTAETRGIEALGEHEVSCMDGVRKVSWVRVRSPFETVDIMSHEAPPASYCIIMRVYNQRSREPGPCRSLGQALESQQQRLG